MRLSDYLRLGLVGFRTHKKRTAIIIIVVGLLFSVITAGVFVLQGIENSVLSKMLAPTGGKVLIISSIDTKVCGKDCDIALETEHIKTNIKTYGGQLIEATAIQNSDGIFYKLEGSIFVDSEISESTKDATAVAIPISTAAKIAGIVMPERAAEVTDKLQAIKEVEEKTLHQSVTSKTNEKYYIADILPSGVYASDLSLTNVGINSNPLDLVLGQARTGSSQNFVLSSVTNIEHAEIDNPIFAEFPNIQSAFAYYQDKSNYCTEINRMSNLCGRDYKYEVFSIVADPLTTYANFQEIWQVFKVVSAVLSIIALIIATTTYARLIEKDKKIISLYHSMGATGYQIRLFYIVHLLVLSLMAVVFAVLIGLALAAVLSLANQSALTQVFILGFGMPSNQIWLIGWNPIIYYILSAALLSAVLAVLSSSGQFSSKKLARNMK